MTELNIQLSTPIALMLASSKGWTPTLEDTTQELEGDSYPLIPNPVSHEEFLESSSNLLLSQDVTTLSKGRDADRFDDVVDLPIPPLP